jgi:peptide/nickel transport system permease protein
VVLAAVVCLAVLAPVLTDPAGLDVTRAAGGRLEPPSTRFWLGTDESGRSVLLLTWWGTRLSLLVGLSALAVAGDAVTGLVAGTSAGGVVALRIDRGNSPRGRALAVVLATIYAFVLVRLAPEAAVVAAPVLPFTALGIADHLRERRAAATAA